MSLDALLPEIRQLQAEGALVVIRWDGERTAARCTVLVTHPGTDEHWRREGDDVAAMLREILAEYRASYPAHLA